MIEYDEPLTETQVIAQQQAQINSLRQVQSDLGHVVEPSRSLPSSTSEEGVGKSETHREPSTNKDSEDDSDKDVT